MAGERPGGLPAQLTCHGFWGDLSRPAVPVNFSSRAGWKGALTDGRLENVQLMVAEDVQLLESDDRAAIPITLAHRLVFPAALNAKSAWQDLTGSGEYLEELPAPFRSGNEAATPGLGHTNGAANVPSAYAGPVIPQNGAWGARFYLYKPPKAQQRPSFSFFWGEYSIQIADGAAEIARVSDAWTQAKEDELYNLLKLDQAGTEIDALRAEIYEDRQRLELGRGEEEWYNTPLSLSVIPEPAGNVYVRCGGKLVVVPHSDIRKTRRPGVLWEAGPIAIANQGGAYFWQMGSVEWATSGRVGLNHYVSIWDFILDEANINGLWDDSLPDTSVEVLSEDTTGEEPDPPLFVQNGEDDPQTPQRRETAIVLSTADDRYSPWFYGVQIYRDPGARNGGRFGDTPTFDSDATEYANGSRSPIADVTVSCEDEMRRRTFYVDMYDLDGKTLSAAPLGDAGFYHPALENQVARLVVDGAPVLTNGLVKTSTAYNMRGGTPNQARVQVTRPDSGIWAVICDAWGVLDEQLIEDDPIGDNITLGAFLRILLKGAGFTDAEIAGVSASDGRILPGAAFGENWLIRPGEGVYRGDYLRDLVWKWGMGWLLYIDANGVWQFESPSQAVVGAFVNNHNTPGALPMLRPLDMPRDTGEFYNDFLISGTDWNGNAISDRFTLHGSIYSTGTPPFKTLIGRRRTKTYYDPAIKTKSDLLWVKRSLKENFGHPPRFAHFESYWNSDAFPGQRWTYDGVLCRIKSITGGSSARNTMNYLLQELM